MMRRMALLHLFLNAICATLLACCAQAQEGPVVVSPNVMAPLRRESRANRLPEDGIMFDADGRLAVSDASKWVTHRPEKFIGSPRPIRRTPLFSNAPFLRLKPGDELVRGRRWFPESKERAHFARSDDLWLKSKGKYYYIGLNPSDTRLSAPYSVLFRWQVNLKAARRLHESSDLDIALAPQKYRAMRAALRKDFKVMLRDDSDLKIRAPRLEGTGKMKRAVFEGLAFDAFTNTVYRYQQIIGDGIFLEFRKTLVAGPTHVSRSDFETPKPWHTSPGIQLNVPPPSSDYERAAKRASYIKLQAFRRVVAPFLPLQQRKRLFAD